LAPKALGWPIFSAFMCIYVVLGAHARHVSAHAQPGDDAAANGRRRHRRHRHGADHHSRRHRSIGGLDGGAHDGRGRQMPTRRRQPRDGSLDGAGVRRPRGSLERRVGRRSAHHALHRHARYHERRCAASPKASPTNRRSTPPRAASTTGWRSCPASGSCRTASGWRWRPLSRSRCYSTTPGSGANAVAVGSNELTARLCGVPVARVRLMIYGLGGLLAGLAGVLEFSTLTVGDPTDSVGLELEAIAAVVIGGGSLSGGQGSRRRHPDRCAAPQPSSKPAAPTSACPTGSKKS